MSPVSSAPTADITLVITLLKTMATVFTKSAAQRTLTYKDQTFETFSLYRSNKAFCVGIASRRPWRASHWLNALSFDGIPEGFAKLSVAVHDQIAVVFETAIKHIGDVACYLHHEGFVGAWRRADAWATHRFGLLTRIRDLLHDLHALANKRKH